MRNENSKLITIATVVRNGDSTLQRALQSVVTQKRPEIEYVLVDGASTDQTPSIINSFREHIDHSIRETDSGVADAFNKAIDVANGEYVGFLNADDWYELGALDHVVRAIQSNPRADVVYGDANLISNFEGTVTHRQANAGHLAQYMSLYHPATFMRTSFIRKIGKFDTRFRYAMDCELLHRAVRDKAEFHHISTTLANMSLDGISHQHTIKAHWEFYRSATKHGLASQIAGISFFARQALLHSVLKTRIGRSLWKLVRTALARSKPLTHR